MNKVPPAFYPDPNSETQMRYWDGQGWTEQVYRLSSPVVIAAYKSLPQPPAKAKLPDPEPSQIIEAVDQVAQTAEEAVEQLESSRQMATAQQSWERLRGASNWEIAQQNKAKIGQAIPTSLLNQPEQQAGIFDSGQQQLWGESDKPGPIKTAWAKVPRSWRKPIITVVLIAFVLWILPSLINLAAGALDAKKAKETVEKVIQPPSNNDR